MTCIAQTKQGTACVAPTLTGRDVCRFHAPELEEERRADAKRGGTTSRRVTRMAAANAPALCFGDDESVDEFLDRFADASIGRPVPPAVASSIMYLCQLVGRVDARLRQEALTSTSFRQPPALVAKSQASLAPITCQDAKDLVERHRRRSIPSKGANR